MNKLPQSGYLLRGKRFLVTRPEGQASGLIEGIRALGGDVAHIPFLAIEAIADQSVLKEIASQLLNYRACIFISANAVRIAGPILAPFGWPQMVAGVAVGPATARALKKLGVSEIIVPSSSFDSEGLLAEPFFEPLRCRDKAFALIRGQGGRDFLARSLRERGAHVDEVAVYRRSLHPEALSHLQAWLNAGIGTLLISSSESLELIVSNASQVLLDILRSVPMLVPHPRIAECAREHGIRNVYISDGGDEGLLDFLQTYNKKSSV